jgi:hypothetical protein
MDVKNLRAGKSPHGSHPDGKEKAGDAMEGSRWGNSEIHFGGKSRCQK